MSNLNQYGPRPKIKTTMGSGDSQQYTDHAFKAEPLQGLRQSNIPTETRLADLRPGTFFEFNSNEFGGNCGRCLYIGPDRWGDLSFVIRTPAGYRVDSFDVDSAPVVNCYVEQCWD